jgi:CRP-like cAMP-binding protein
MKPFAKTYKAGAHLFHENDHSRELYIIQSGVVRVYRRVGMRDVELARLHKGAVLGEMALIDGKARSASAQATQDCSVVIIDADTFFTRTRGVPPWFVGIIRMVSQKVRNANKRLQKAHSEYPGANIILALQHMLYRKQRHSGSERCTLELSTARNQLIQLCSTTAQQIVSILQFLHSHDLITLEDDTLTAADCERFIEYCTFVRTLIRKGFAKVAPIPGDLFDILVSVTEQELSTLEPGEARRDIDGSAMEALFARRGGSSPRETADELAALGLVTIHKNRSQEGESAEDAQSLGSMRFTVDCARWRSTMLYNRYKDMVFGQ